MNIQEEQKKMIDSIKEQISFNEQKTYQSSKWRDSVFFYCSSGEFIYNDACVKHEIIKPLIDNGILLFKGIEKHQGESMPRYILNPIKNKQQV
jgi:hypothetical protein